ncbi:MAG TPA: hypothetical protein VFQ44_06725 [Streptosporangiaceae bacterium]|nr:hypothetical protein [Streptosporangiaceae bacterium]
MSGQDQPGGESTVAAVLRLADLAGQIERVDNAASRRIDDLARDCVAAQDQLDAVCGLLEGLAGRADEAEERLAEVSGLLGRMSAQINALFAPDDAAGQGDEYRVNQGAPWWKAGDSRCEEAAERLADWVQDVYQPVFGYLADLLAPCWRRHLLCLAYLDVLHEGWCLLYLGRRDPKMVFAQLDWLNRSLVQAAEVMANETRRCRELGRHREGGQESGPFSSAWQLESRR